MKHTIIKILSVAMVLILLSTVFVGCNNTSSKGNETTPALNQSDGQGDLENDENDQEDDGFVPVFTLGSLEPLSRKKQEEIEAAWKTNDEYNSHHFDLNWYGDVVDGYTMTVAPRYYGTFNDEYIVIYSPEYWDMGGKMVLAGQTIKSNSVFDILVYFEGVFYDISEAVENGWLTDSDLLDIVEYHNAFEEYNMKVYED